MPIVLNGIHGWRANESNEESEKLNVVKSSEDILHCPTCDQALRVQIEKRPVMSRCPVCKTQFMAEAEEV